MQWDTGVVIVYFKLGSRTFKADRQLARRWDRAINAHKIPV